MSASGVPGLPPVGQQHDPGVVEPRSISSSARIIPFEARRAALRRSSFAPSAAPHRVARPRPSLRLRSSTRRTRSAAARPRRRRPRQAAAGRHSGASPLRGPCRHGTARGFHPRSGRRDARCPRPRPRRREAGRELGERHVDRDVVAEPGDGTLKTVSGRGGRPPEGADLGDAVTELRGALEPDSRTRSRSTLRGRARRSGTRAGRPCRRRPSRSSRVYLHVRQPSPPQTPHDTSGSIDGSVNGK